jgi:hypothetical protein
MRHLAGAPSLLLAGWCRAGEIQQQSLLTPIIPATQGATPRFY